ncbi:hypothetical protein B4U80_14323 [Leptotrombidium deliense]|uniref:Uncharacterized protein n=1 Tax=Leptotrombidium deliense TaxID=299467 RepID=A0A443RXM7_9ACAR|nr:hypothetical protein B4U80_14323 [Leptotrombidium deliense]
MSPHRPQNYRTPFIDAGFIYGTNKEQNDAVRLRKNGLLKTEFKKNGRSEFMIDDGVNDIALCGYNSPCLHFGDLSGTFILIK